MPETSHVQSSTLTPTLTRLIAAALLAILAILLITSARQESQTFDESTHLFAGFEYWKHADFGRNPEHPPFIKLLAAVPLLSMGLKEPPSLPIPFFKAQDLINGGQLLYSSDADANTVLFRGRLVIMLFTLTLALLVFLATNEIFGRDPRTLRALSLHLPAAHPRQRQNRRHRRRLGLSPLRLRLHLLSLL